MEKQFGRTGFQYNSSIEWENTGRGVRRKIMAYDADIMMVMVEFNKGAIGAKHTHPNKQVTYVAKGSFEININDEKKIEKAGDVFFVLPNVEHGVTALEDGMMIDVFTPYREDFVKKS